MPWPPLTPLLQSGDPPGPPTSPLQLTPVLVESQIQRIAETAAILVKSLPDLEPKTPNIKKKICKELEVSNPGLAPARGLSLSANTSHNINMLPFFFF